MVAIPSLFLYWIFNQKLNGIVARCELITEEFLQQIRVIKRRKRRQSAAAKANDDDGDGDDSDQAKPAAKEASL